MEAAFSGMALVPENVQPKPARHEGRARHGGRAFFGRMLQAAALSLAVPVVFLALSCKKEEPQKPKKTMPDSFYYYPALVHDTLGFERLLSSTLSPGDTMEAGIISVVYVEYKDKNIAAIKLLDPENRTLLESQLPLRNGFMFGLQGNELLLLHNGYPVPPWSHNFEGKAYFILYSLPAE